MALVADRGSDDWKARNSVDWVALWLMVSAWWVLSGWGLSLLGLLDLRGCLVSLFLLAGAVWFGRKQLGLFGLEFSLTRLWSFHPGRWLPKAWLLLTLLVFTGGALYHPCNYDYLTYRFPRILHWQWVQHWHWIYTPNHRMNFAATGFEWLMVPLFVFFKTDRLFFLVNIVSFLLLPGLVFSVFQRLGISKRVSWWWMWLLPCGYCYVLQAGSVANDFFATIYLLASLHYILKAGERNAVPSVCFFWSCLAIALTTGAKASNLPLVLPWAVAVYLQRNHLWKIKPGVWLGTFFISGWASFLPTGTLNIYYTGKYTGDPNNLSQRDLHDPVAGFMGNSLQVIVGNFRPPVWPKEVLLNQALPDSFKAYLIHAFPHFTIMIDQIEIEEFAGLGLPLVACALLMVGLSIKGRRTQLGRSSVASRYLRPIGLASCLALVIVFFKLGSEDTARLMAPYYPLLIATVLSTAAVNGGVIRYLICKIFAAAAMGVATLLVVFSPSRPLFPTDLAASVLARVFPSQAARVERVYDVYRTRWDGMKDLRVFIPDDEKVIGFLQLGDNPEVSLWRPFGSRRVVEVTPDQSVDQLKAAGVRLVVTSDSSLSYEYHMNIEELTKKWSAVVVAKKELILRAAQGPDNWYIVELP